jgi:hypothetical protein
MATTNKGDTMSKKSKEETQAVEAKLDYTEFYDWLPGKEVNVGLVSGAVLGGAVEYIDQEIIVVVMRPTSLLDIETKVNNTIVYQSQVNYITFKTDRE